MIQRSLRPSAAASRSARRSGVNPAPRSTRSRPGPPGQERLVAPQRGGPGLDLLPEVGAVDRVQVVGGLERPEALLADRERFDRVLGAADPAPQRRRARDRVRGATHRRGHPVMAPWSALPTSLAYFASAPGRVTRLGRRPRLAPRRRASRRRRAARASARRRRSGSGRPPRRARSARRRRPPARCAHAEALRRAGEPAVGDQRDVLAEPGAGDRGGHGEHLRHPRRTLRAFVADHDHVARGDPAGRHRGERVLLGVERASAVPSNTRPSAPAIFTTAPSGRGCPEDRGPAAGVDRRRPAAHDVAVGRGRRQLGEVLGLRLPGHGEAVAVEQPGVEQLLHHDRARRPRGRGRSSRTARPAGRRRGAASGGRSGRSRRAGGPRRPRGRSRGGGARRSSSPRPPSRP